MRFHELRHTFGTLAIQRASILQVQNWLGHADIKTTQIYLRYRSQEEDAALLSEIFALEASAGVRPHMATRSLKLNTANQHATRSPPREPRRRHASRLCRYSTPATNPPACPWRDRLPEFSGFVSRAVESAI